MNLDAPIVSVITSGCVAVAGIFLPLVLNILVERQKWSREQKSAKLEEVNQASKTLLELLAIFRSGDVQLASGRSVKSVYSELLGKYYLWEQIAYSYLDIEERGTILQLRKEFEAGDYQKLFHEGPELADKVIGLTYSAIDKIR
jgi:hypothetical protein